LQRQVEEIDFFHILDTDEHGFNRYFWLS